ncbi:MAG: class I SAM-dependent methyltransferase [Nitrosotalea sp.]
MKKDLLKLLIDPNTKSSFSLKQEVAEGDEVVSGVLEDTNGNTYAISNHIPHFVKNYDSPQSIESFSYKWNLFVNAALRKQDSNKAIFLEQYGWTDNDFITFIKTRKNILDAGCGVGYISNWVATESKAQVFGIDISQSVDNAYVNFGSKRNNLHFMQANIEELPFKEKSFDLIICKEVIHHTPEPRKNFSKLVNLLSDDGVITIYVYKKKGPIREFCDDYIRDRTTKLSVEDCKEFSQTMTELGKSLRQAKVTIDIPKDITFLNIKAGKYDLQRFIYWNMFKCFWDDDGDKDYSDAVNFDWYHPEHAYRYTPDEIRVWFEEEGIRIDNFNVLDAGITVRGTKTRK